MNKSINIKLVLVLLLILGIVLSICIVEDNLMLIIHSIILGLNFPCYVSSDNQMYVFNLRVAFTGNNTKWLFLILS